MEHAAIVHKSTITRIEHCRTNIPVSDMFQEVMLCVIITKVNNLQKF